jgi:hypothetical protein
MKIVVFLSALCLASFFVSCSESSTPVSTEKTVVSEKVSEEEQYRYYSFETDQFIPASEASTKKWDMRLPAIKQLGQSRTVDIVFNSGNVNPVGEVLGQMRNLPYSFVKDMGGEFNPDYLLDTAKRIINPYVIGNPQDLYFQYANTVVTPNPSKTVVLRLTNGDNPTWVKLQIISLYKGNPIVPTFTDSLSFYSFRYTKTKGTSF